MTSNTSAHDTPILLNSIHILVFVGVLTILDFGNPVGKLWDDQCSEEHLEHMLSSATTNALASKDNSRESGFGKLPHQHHLRWDLTNAARTSLT